MNRPRQPHHGQGGFSLIEMLVAVVLVGMVLTVFLQVFSGSMRLSRKSRAMLEHHLQAEALFSRVLLQDERDEYFAWQGENDIGRWEIVLQELDTVVPLEEQDEITLALPSELFIETLTFYPAATTTSVVLQQIRRWPLNHFSEDFRLQNVLPAAVQETIE
ncbi:type II secretion system protein [uncultured Desulfuromonas sp.]|uniref:PulJ/GspJ family protein n=1 Tax=uncultured Desulfuromonas sp. TaxID=181013 RepID=UPI002AABD162|nr:type II secretion system protein [uncultured Desulfuromonas sp.]